MVVPYELVSVPYEPVHSTLRGAESTSHPFPESQFLHR